MTENKQSNNKISLKKMLMKKAAIARIPLNGIFELTPRCNMDCRMCYIRMSTQQQLFSGSEKNAEQWIDMGKECAGRGMLFLLLTGGEPFLRPDFKEIYEGLKKLGLIISINSNGTLIDEKTVEWLKKDPPSSINITLYGGDKETYKKLCRFENGFERVIKAIELLKEAGIAVVINLSLTKENEKDFEKMTEIANKYDLPVRVATYMFPAVRKAKICEKEENVRFTPKESGEMRFRSMKAQMSADEYQKMIEQIKSGNYTVSEFDECEHIPGEPMSCMAGKSTFWITWDGRMTPCGMMNDPVQYPFKNGMKASWEKLVSETKKIILPAECAKCKAKNVCRACAAMIKAESGGDSTKKPEYICESTEYFLKALNEAENAGKEN